MSELTRSGASIVLQHGFVATGEHDQSEGRGGRRELGIFTTAEEAIAAARGTGLQGDSGYVSLIEWVQYEGGLIVREHRRGVWERRRTPRNTYEVGWVDAQGNYTDAPFGEQPSNARETGASKR